MSPLAKAVPASLRNLLGKLAHVEALSDFYLAGGTGLALHLSHRRSVDLDFFSTENRLRAEERRALIGQLKRLSPFTLIEEKDGTLHVRLGRVRVSFFWSPYPPIKPFARCDSLRVASMEDIGLMKIGAIIGRGSRKDFIDLYEICRRMPLKELLRLGEKKFKDSRDFPLQALKALSFFEDAEAEPEVVSVKPIRWGKVKDFFTREVHTLARQYFRGRI